MQALAEYVEWVKSFTHSKWLYGLLFIFAFLFWKLLINFPVWAVGQILALYYSPKRLSDKMEISTDSSRAHIMVSKQPGNLPAIREALFRIVNTLRFFDVEIRRAEVEIWAYQQLFISRERFVGEVVKSTRATPVVFNIDLDELRLARLKESFPPNRPDSLTLTVKLTIQCATFFRIFEVQRNFQYLVKIY